MTRAERDTLIVEHLGLADLAASIAGGRALRRGFVEREDLVAVAREALVVAAGRYDASRGASFGTFVRPRLFGAVLDYLRSFDTVSRKERDRISRGERTEPAPEMLSAYNADWLDRVRPAPEAHGRFCPCCLANHRLILERFLTELRPRDREIVALWLAGRTCAEIARTMGLHGESRISQILKRVTARAAHRYGFAPNQKWRTAA